MGFGRRGGAMRSRGQVVGVAMMFVVVLTLTAGCGPRVPPSAAEPWLQSHSGIPASPLAGTWQVADWGGSTGYATPNFGFSPFSPLILDASGGSLTGVWGEYQLAGAADGVNVYLIASSEESVYYTIILRLLGGGSALVGKICDGFVQAADDDCDSFNATRLGTTPSGDT
jgi:hypothetical protein